VVQQAALRMLLLAVQELLLHHQLLRLVGPQVAQAALPCWCSCKRCSKPAADLHNSIR
jgi:hypothetical protein